MKKVIWLSLVLCLSAFLSAGSGISSVEAGSGARCAIPKFEKAFEQAEAVFIGEVLSEKAEGRMKTFVLEVKRFWKGVESRKMTINVYENPRYQAQFKVGKSYLVFAEADDDGRLFDRRCSRTKLIMKESIGSLKDDLKALGEAKTCIELGQSESN